MWGKTPIHTCFFCLPEEIQSILGSRGVAFSCINTKHPLWNGGMWEVSIACWQYWVVMFCSLFCTLRMKTHIPSGELKNFHHIQNTTLILSGTKKEYEIKDELFDDYTEMAINLYNVNVYKIRWKFGWVRLLEVRFEISKLSKISSNLQNLI